ncbi:aminotransferase class III-fold pyridoxal phosphate-dependent enzyme [Endozoicomonas numazuensis]|uniref:Omega amino acid--pyruvate aminotransferase n=1 Tax=Endozoicomonas numazuensis TaxID=1137799 RepID=A0A081NLF5_9GAMM|nr:aminotransferase class III-fold pyridoxal phosphate-dependent enzyme [Endozoicomonas numazuensis]KEQ19278.1 omega amino acid--pyruvate aminotransferase [Endozoicomonas numazuensis]
MSKANGGLTEEELKSFWMPFSTNRLYKAAPHFLREASGLYFKSDKGQRVMDAVSGLWCCSLGHGRKEIAQAVYEQLCTLDYAPSYQLSHELPFKLSRRLLNYLPDDFSQVFYVNSGSEAAETALKMALAYHQLSGKTEKVRLIGRELGYHGAGFGAISVGGIPNNSRLFPNQLQFTDRLPVARGDNPFIKGEPERDDTQAEKLLELIEKYSAETIAAVIVEPVSCSGGVLVPPEGYLKRLREICTEHDILLIVDEVICALGRLGHPFSSVERFGVIPDFITTAKSLANGVIPLGAVFVRSGIYDVFLSKSDTLVDFFHGYTFTANPAACAAAMACMDIAEREGLYYRASELESYWEQAVHSLRGSPHVKDIRNLGLLAGIELVPAPGELPGYRTWQLFRNCFEKGVLVRANGEVLALCPPLIIETSDIDYIINVLSDELGKLK